MNRLEFINKIFRFYRTNDENGELARTYDRALSTKYSVNWEELYNHVIKTAETKILPLPKYFVDKLPTYKKIEAIKGCDNLNQTIRVIFQDDNYLDFTTVAFETKTTIESMKKKFEYEDENQNKQSKIKKIICYPKETTLIGSKAFFNVHIPNSEKMQEEELKEAIKEQEEILSKQVKTIFISK